MKIIITKFRPQYRFAKDVGMTDEEIESQGWFGVCQAARKYDPTRPNPVNPGQPIEFMTYAAWWIRQNFSRAAEERLKSTGFGREKNDGVGLLQLLRDPKSADPAEMAENDELHGRVAAILRQLPERYRQVLELRYGLKDGVARTLIEIGDVLGVTGERIRQMELKCLEQIRVPLQLACADLLTA